ncbi:MAG: hypothetical protein ACK5R0_14435 [Bacteroidota bacterium]|jgi:hypothetical protein
MTNNEIISWLLEGDVSIQYQTHRDLLDTDKPNLRKKIESEGWGLQFLSYRQQNGHWGRGFYQPKWTSSHYTLLDLKNLNIPTNNKSIRETLNIIFENEKGADGGILPIGTIKKSDVCVNGMVLNYSSYFHTKEELLKSIVDFLLSEEMSDGGFNCQSNRKGAVHSSLHSTLSVLEGISEYERNGYSYRLNELKNAKLKSQEFILMHRLFRSDRTGDVINPNFLKLYYPSRWYYDILKALDYFRVSKVKYDKRMDDAINVILEKRTVDGQWKLASKHPGQTHFEMEKSGKPSRWNTLRVLRVLRHFNIHG